MPAGDSAALESHRQGLLAGELERLATAAKEMERRFAAAAHSERRLAHTLEVLESRGYTVLADRRWPKSRRAQVDFIVAGPGGVFIVDAKAWRDVTVAGGAVFRDQADVTDDFANIADLADSTRTILADIGLAPGEVHALAVFTDKRNFKSTDLYGVTLLSEAEVVTRISRAGARLSTAQLANVVEALDELFPIYETDNSLELDLSFVEPVLPEDLPDLLPEAVYVNRLTAAEIESALVEGVMALPIEDWMAFLHPTQAKLVNRTFSGPSRIRGAAGTGKTVVGLHRAAYLARSNQGKVLVTAFVRTLPAVLESLLARLAPDVSDRVEFHGVYSFALDVLKQRGVHVNLQHEEAESLFDATWSRYGADLEVLDPSADYWLDEINAVIKGRGIRTIDQYSALARSGRRRRLTVEQRRHVWRFYVAYEKARIAAQIYDFPDVILHAAASLRTKPLEGYSAVIIDEAQDLTCMMVRMLHSLVGNKPDGLNLIGDGQQTIYPGGFTLAEANVSIAGRGVVMTTNYRNTFEIVEFAASLVAGDEFVDIEGAISMADASQEILRHGPAPMITRFASTTLHDESLVDHVLAVKATGTSYGDVGVLALANWQAAHMVKALQAAGIPTVELTHYSGQAVDAVKVGTVHRAKGLEFKQVLMARTPRSLLESAPAADNASSERRELDRRALYVAMTRARDGLWVGVS
ncbi:3'-5' exonuclease [Conyzicola sp.]|uniref:nuclease-related domain-containing DEAD/DEAH box helicase n=1 Tax=Conyzicola sp. TaxID=1969404 RepID=UPI003988C69A